MVWKISRENIDKGETVVAAPDFATGELAFRAAMGNVTDFITSHWDTATGNTVDGPGDDARFKTYIHRSTLPVLIELRYDWLDLAQPIEDQPRTNSVIWSISEV